MPEHVEPSVEDLQRGNLRAMTNDQLDAEAKAADTKLEAYQALLDAEFRRRGRKRPK